jgi:protein-S-isoprenylcysteine O-methyltransferase Ste14
MGKLRGLETRIPPPVVALLCAAMGLALNLLVPSARILPPAALPVGLVLIGLGAALAVAAVVQFVRAGTTIEPLDPGKTTRLVVSGVYSFTRNPMYLAMLLAVLGIALMTRNPLALIGVVLFPAYITRLQILPEERALRAIFGEPFDSYCRKVRRWV